MKGFVGVLCAGLLLCFAEDAMSAASLAAQVFAAGVMPALFPMMVLTRLMPCEGRAASRAAAVMFSFASGSPASAQRVSQLCAAGRVTRGELLPLLAACGVMSPMFFVGTLAKWTGLRGAMWGMLGVHWLGAAAVGVGARAVGSWRSKVRACRAPDAKGVRTANAVDARGIRARMRYAVNIESVPANPSADKRSAHAAHASPPPAQTVPSSPTLTAAVSASAQALLAVCGAMMLFSVAAGVLRALLHALFPLWTAQNARLLSVLWALLEIGGGAKAVLEAWGQPPLALLSFLCAFGGLSICLQNLLFVGAYTRPAKLLMLRLLHGVVCAALCALLFSLFPSAREAFAVSVPSSPVSYRGIASLWSFLLIGLACLPTRGRA